MNKILEIYEKYLQKNCFCPPRNKLSLLKYTFTNKDILKYISV